MTKTEVDDSLTTFMGGCCLCCVMAVFAAHVYYADEPSFVEWFADIFPLGLPLLLGHLVLQSDFVQEIRHTGEEDAALIAADLKRDQREKERQEIDRDLSANCEYEANHSFHEYAKEEPELEHSRLAFIRYVIKELKCDPKIVSRRVRAILNILPMVDWQLSHPVSRRPLIWGALTMADEQFSEFLEQVSKSRWLKEMRRHHGWYRKELVLQLMNICSSPNYRFTHTFVCAAVERFTGKELLVVLRLGTEGLKDVHSANGRASERLWSCLLGKFGPHLQAGHCFDLGVSWCISRFDQASTRGRVLSLLADISKVGHTLEEVALGTRTNAEALILLHGVRTLERVHVGFCRWGDVRDICLSASRSLADIKRNLLFLRRFFVQLERVGGYFCYIEPNTARSLLERALHLESLSASYDVLFQPAVTTRVVYEPEYTEHGTFPGGEYVQIDSPPVITLRVSPT